MKWEYILAIMEQARYKPFLLFHLTGYDTRDIPRPGDYHGFMCNM